MHLGCNWHRGGVTIKTMCGRKLRMECRGWQASTSLKTSIDGKHREKDGSARSIARTLLVMSGARWDGIR